MHLCTATRLALVLLSAITLLTLTSCDELASRTEKRTPEEQVYTLYRGTPFGEPMRIHVATFDAADSERYNKENAEIARDLFQGQPGVVIKYWIEKGYYRP